MAMKNLMEDDVRIDLEALANDSDPIESENLSEWSETPSKEEMEKE